MRDFPAAVSIREQVGGDLLPLGAGGECKRKGRPGLSAVTAQFVRLPAGAVGATLASRRRVMRSVC